MNQPPHAQPEGVVDTLGGREFLEVEPEAGIVRIAFSAAPHFCHNGDVVHSGFIAGWLDMAMENAIMEQTCFEVAVSPDDIRISFVRDCRPGRVVAEGRVIHRQARTAWLEGRLTDREGEVVALGTSTVTLHGIAP